MKPIGPLMREHRLIERMVALLEKEPKRIASGNKADVEFLTVAIDFLRTYADRTHHGKEEDILFRELAGKRISQEHQTIMKELVEEHVYARKMVASLDNARESYTKGNPESLKDIVSCLQALVNLYPSHIEKEDKHFFYPSLDYLSEPEQAQMLNEFWEFDRKLIHEKYEKLVERTENLKSS